MNRINEVTLEFVDLLPQTLVDGVVYISMEHRTVVHNCCSGCGERVVIGLSPAQWTLTFDGEAISFDHSFGNGVLACNSHYWIRENKVIWSKPLTPEQTRRSQLADRRAVVAHHEPEKVPAWRLIKRWKLRRQR